MLILSLDSSQSDCSVSLLKNDEILETVVNSNPREQSELLVPMIQNLLANNNCDFKDIDLFAVTTGPGSFTGIRIGLATMRGFAIAMEKPLIGISSFDIYADHSSVEDREVLVVLESLRKELFFQYFDEKQNYKYDAVNCLIEDLPFDISDNVIITGNAAHKFNDKIEYKQENLSEYLGKMAYKRYNFNDFNILDYPAIPYYLRDPDVTISKKKTRQIK